MSRNVFRVSPTFVRAAHHDWRTLTQLASPAGLHQGQLSLLLRGKVFGLLIRGRILRIGKRLGLEADECTRAARGVVR